MFCLLSSQPTEGQNGTIYIYQLGQCMSIHLFPNIQEDVDKPYQYVRVIEEVPHEVLAQHAITISIHVKILSLNKTKLIRTDFFFIILISPRS